VHGQIVDAPGKLTDFAMLFKEETHKYYKKECVASATDTKLIMTNATNPLKRLQHIATLHC
jgi:hypothetical protein